MTASGRYRGSRNSSDAIVRFLNRYLHNSEQRWQENERRWQEGHNRWEYQQKITQHLILTMDQHMELSERRWSSQNELNRTMNSTLGSINTKVDQILVILNGRPGNS